MVAATAGRKGRPWERVQARVYQEETNCYLQPWTGCRGHVDQTLPPRTPGSRSVHHLIPPDIRPDLANVRSNLRLAHFGCNSSYGRGEYETRPGRVMTPQRMQALGRVVVVLFGPPGAGKTTIARESGLTVYDRDDEAWAIGGDNLFRQALDQLGRDPQAHAVAIRSGATSSARAKTMRQVNATHAYLVMADPATCHQRAGHRRRHDVHTSHAAIGTWFAHFDHDDGMPTWPGGWDPMLANRSGALQRGTPYRGSRNW